MSTTATSWAWSQPTRSSGQRLVLLAICDHAGHHDGWGDRAVAWPSVARIAAMTGLSESTVRTHIDTLHADELIVKIERRRRRSGTLGTWVYGIGPDATSDDRSAVVDDATTADPSAHETADPSAHETADPSARNRTVRVNHQSEPSAGRTPPDDEQIDHESAVIWLCELLVDLIEQTGARRPTVTQRWRTDMDRLIRIDERTPDQIERVLRWLHASNDPVAAFWWPNVRSPGKLRERWDQIAAQVAARRHAATAARQPSPLERIRNATGGTP